MCRMALAQPRLDPHPQPRYPLQVVALAIVVAFLGIAASVQVWLTSGQALQKTLVTEALGLLYLLAWAIPLIVTLAAFMHVLASGTWSTMAPWGVVALASVVAVHVFYEVSSNCEVSASVQREMATKLSVRELRSVRNVGWMCSATFEYTSDESGRRMRAFGVADFVEGPRVYFARADQ